MWPVITIHACGPAANHPVITSAIAETGCSMNFANSSAFSKSIASLNGSCGFCTMLSLCSSFILVAGAVFLWIPYHCKHLTTSIRGEKRRRTQNQPFQIDVCAIYRRLELWQHEQPWGGI